MTLSDIPYHAFDHDLMLKLAQSVLEDREGVYPSLVEKGRMTEQEAADGIRVMRAIVADRQRVVDLRARRPAPPRDATATDYEKRLAARYIHARAIDRRDKAEAAFKALLGNDARHAFEQDMMTYPAIRAAYSARFPGWDNRVIGIWLYAEERTWETHALLWHTERWPMDALNAEMLAAPVAEARSEAA